MNDQNAQAIFTESFNTFLMQLGLADVTPERKKELMDKFESIVNTQAIQRLDEVLTDEQREKLKTITEDEEVDNYLDSIGISMQAIVMEVTLALREDMIRDTAYFEGLLASQK